MAAFGSGERCLPGDITACGDGGRAEDARLAYPKGKISDRPLIYLLFINHIYHVLTLNSLLYEVVNQKNVYFSLVSFLIFL